jgi:hypothetical protein
MAKVITAGREGAALAAAGKPTTEVFKDERPKARQAAPPLEMKAGDGAAPPVVDSPEIKAAEAAEVKDPEAHIDAEDKDLSDIAMEEARDKARRKITKYANRWQAELKAKETVAQELADSERFAETLFNEREAYRKKADEAEARALAAEAGKPKPPEFVAPDENDPKYKNDKGEFEWKKFSTDNAAYEAKKAIAEDRKAQAEQATRAQAQADEAKFKERIAQAVKKNPDWLQKVTDSPVMLQNSALEYIKLSEYGTDISYHLATNPDVADKIKAMHPIMAIAAIRDIETGFLKPAAKTPSGESSAPSKTVERVGAPAPITTISTSGTGSINVDPAKMSFQELRAYERSRAKRR